MNMKSIMQIRFLLVCVLLMIPFITTAQTKVALVIGNSNYTDVTFPKLTQPLNDASEINNKLRQLGFKTITVNDGSKQEMLDAINQFERLTRNADVGVFYYSGHATNINYTNYLVPVKTTLHIATLSDECVNLKNISTMMDKNCKLALLFLDACRSEVPTDGIHKGIVTPSGFVKKDTKTNSPVGCMICYATENGKIVGSGYGKLSPFTKSLAKFLTDGREFREVWASIREEVSSNCNLNPVSDGSYTKSFYFNKGGATLSGSSTNTDSTSANNNSDKNKVYITFNVTPKNAKLYFGDKTYSTGTPLPFELGGNYSYKVEAEGYQTKNGTFTASNSSPSTMNVNLTKAESATLKVYCDNRNGATVYLDGERIGRTPVTFTTTTGSHLLKMQSPGYYTYETKLNITSGTNKVNRHLDKMLPEFWDWEGEGGNIASYHFSPKYQIGLSYLYRPEDCRFSFGAMVATSTGICRGWSNPLTVSQSMTIIIGGNNEPTVDSEGNKIETSYTDLSQEEYSSRVDPYNEAKHYESNALFLADVGFNPCNGIMIEAGVGAGYHKDKYYMDKTYTLKSSVVTNSQTGESSTPTYEYIKDGDSKWYKQNSKWSPAFRLGTKFFIPLGPLGDYEGYLTVGGGYTYLPTNHKCSSWDANIGLTWCF